MLTAVGIEVPTPFPSSLPLPATSRQVAQFVALRAAACVGADYANLALLNPAQDSLRLFHDSFLAQDIADRYTDVPIGAAYPIAVAVREGRVVLLPDMESYREQFPDIVRDTVAAGVQATASIPLNRSDGTPLGALGFAWTDRTAFRPKLVAALRAVAMLCVATVERAERYDADHELVVALQNRLLGELPTLLGIETSARYLPATASLAVGGDWYEGLVLADAQLALVVGDVTGHGIAAAADMALIRGMISALLHSGVPPADVFSELSGVLGQRGDPILATAALAIVDTALETLTFVTAGHPPPLLRLPRGEVRQLGTANGPMIGAFIARTAAGTAPFPRGSRLVMYTDGLVERRDRPFEVGVAQAEAHLAGIADDAVGPHLLDSLIGALVGDGNPSDDVAVLVVHHTKDA